MRSKSSKSILLLLAILLGLMVSCKSQPQTQFSSQPSPTLPNLKPMSFPTPVVGKPYPGIGIVTLINKKEGWIEINHEEIADLMPPMVMEWHVKDPALLNRVKVGDKVNFVVVETGTGEIITDLSKIQEQK